MDTTPLDLSGYDRDDIDSVTTLRDKAEAAACTYPKYTTQWVAHYEQVTACEEWLAAIEEEKWQRL